MLQRSTFPRLFRRCVLALAALTTLSACGGGGGGSGGPLPTVDVSPVAKADPGSALPANWQKGAFMEVFVRSYQDSDGNGVGDLQGLISRLDYLQDLGVHGLWLMPVTASEDHDHGYAVSDYRNVEGAYGSLDDLKLLISEAHKRGIGVILDYVINHSAAQNPLFLNSAGSGSNPYRNWYVWQGNHPSGWSIYGSDPWRSSSTGYYFAPFWDQMPDWNLTNADVLAYHQDNLRFWLNLGVDGFRFDAVGNLVENGPNAWEDQPQNYQIMAGIRSMLDGYQQRFMVCEGPADPLGFSAACGSAFAFGHQSDVVNAAKGNATAIQSVANYFVAGLGNAPLDISTMVSNHDSFAGQRLYDQVGGNLAQYRLAAATYLLQPGTPFIYYGEEVGMAGGPLSGDPKLRTPMSWTQTNIGNDGFTTGQPYRALSSNVSSFNAAAQIASANSLRSFYKALLTLRNGTPALSQGNYEASSVQGGGYALTFRRTLGTEHAVVIINYGGSPASVALAGLPPSATVTVGFSSGAAPTVVSDASGNASVAMGAQSVTVLTYSL